MTQPSRIGTREQILATALELFSSNGYAATSLRAIADRLHMTKAALYYHFPAKELLLLELTRPFIDGLSRQVTDLRSSSDRDARQVLAAYLDLFIEQIDLVALMSQEPATLNHPDVGPRLRTLVLAIQGHLAGADAAPERTVHAACAMGVVHAVAQMPVESVREHRDAVLAAAVAALGAETERTASRAAPTGT